MRTIAVIARKGGSGKTTLSLHLAIAAHLRGLRTLVADADPQRSSSTVLRGRTGNGPNFIQTSGAQLCDVQRIAVRRKMDAMLIDTPAGAEEDLSHAIVLADLSVLVIRPTFLDFAAALETAETLRAMRRPGIIVLNQAPVAREGLEPPLVRKAQAAVQLMRLPLAPAMLRARTAYQQAMETGRSTEETAPDGQAALEVAQLWRYVENLVFGARGERMRA
ncbi:MAG TPA: ParA family protein [Caulobacteraceae bacterium]|nr:ParA family protein [Caulobacteraceae bacterium]